MKPRPSRRRGLSLVETLVSLAITSMLLTAIAAAFNASTAAITDNDQFFRATQGARVALHQILTQLRQVEEISVDPSGQSISFYKVNPVSGDEEIFTYQYVSADRELRLVLADVEGTPSYRLASDVQSVSFRQDSDDINGDHVQFVVRVSVSIRVKIGDNDLTLSGTTVPRRNLRYH